MSILRTEGIIKDYPGTRALDDVTVSFNSGKVHAFIGKNGSGKSTLVKVFAGAIQPTSGHFYLDDEELHFSTPVEALNKGIATVYQELSLVPHLSVAENIFLGRLPKKGRLVDWKRTYQMAGELLHAMGVDIDPHEKVFRLSMWQCQVVEITKAMSFKPKVLMLDEPTSALAANETQKLFEAIRMLKKAGCNHYLHLPQATGAVGDCRQRYSTAGWKIHRNRANQFAAAQGYHYYDVR